MQFLRIGTTIEVKMTHIIDKLTKRRKITLRFELIPPSIRVKIGSHRHYYIMQQPI